MKLYALAFAAAAGAFTLGMAAPASAFDYIGAAHPCSTGDVIPTATSCAGYYEGNALGGSPDDMAAWQDAYTRLGLAGTPVQVFHGDTATDDPQRRLSADTVVPQEIEKILRRFHGMAVKRRNKVSDENTCLRGGTCRSGRAWAWS